MKKPAFRVFSRVVYIAAEGWCSCCLERSRRFVHVQRTNDERCRRICDACISVLSRALKTGRTQRRAVKVPRDPFVRALYDWTASNAPHSAMGAK
jgi:hypothetical protein